MKEGKIQLTRRPTGGNAVLHSGGLTYCLIWPFPPNKKRESYIKTNKWLIEGFSKLGLQLEFGKEAQNILERNCFNSATQADLIDKNGSKRIGSAQLWKGKYLLQHGEILLDPPEELWQEVFKSKAPDPTPESIPRKGLDALLLKAFLSCWPEIKFKHFEITKKELKEISIDAKKYFMQINQAELSTIPAETIASTTCGSEIPKG